MRKTLIALTLISPLADAARLAPIDNPPPPTYTPSETQASIVAILSAYRYSWEDMQRAFEKLFGDEPELPDLHKYGSYDFQGCDQEVMTDKTLGFGDPLFFFEQKIDADFRTITRITVKFDNQTRFYDGSTPVIIQGEPDGYWDWKFEEVPPWNTGDFDIAVDEGIPINADRFTFASMLLDRKVHMGSYTATGCEGYEVTAYGSGDYHVGTYSGFIHWR